jgi:hypothetical protein
LLSFINHFLQSPLHASLVCNKAPTHPLLLLLLLLAGAW